MGNVGGIFTATRAIINAQHGEFEMLRDDLNVSKEDLLQVRDAHGQVILKMDKHGHVMGNTLIPALQRFVELNFPHAMDAQMRTLPGIFSNLEDIVTEGIRRAGEGAYKAVEAHFFPAMQVLGDSVPADVLKQKGYTPGMGLTGDVGGLFTRFTEDVGGGLAALATQGLGALERWMQQMGGLGGVILAVERAWASFAGTLRAGLSIVQGVGDAVGNVVVFVRDLAGIFETTLSPVRFVFDLFRAGHDSLREIVSVVVTLGVELKVLATVLALVQGAKERFTGTLGGESAALAANTSALQANTASAA
jgi:hypothetical protein